MMNYSTAKLAFVALLAFSILFPTSSALGIRGAIITEEVSPGQELLHVITVGSREGEAPLNLTAEVFGFRRTDDGVNVEISPDDDTGPYTARPFLSIEPKSFTLEPGDQRSLLLTGTVPEDVGSGGRYAIVTISTVPSSEDGVAITFALQSIILLTIKDSDLLMTGEVSDLAASMSDGNVSVDLLLENTGNVHYTPLFGAVLLDEAGDIVAEQKPEVMTGVILPTNSRLVKMTLAPEAELEPGTYTVEATVALDDGTVLAAEETTIEV